VTVGELTKSTVLRSWGPRKRATLANRRQGVVTLPYAERVAVTWDPQARTERRGRARPVNDTWIAARCLVRGLPFAALSVKDFADFAQHEGLQLLTPWKARTISLEVAPKVAVMSADQRPVPARSWP
jgi:toxin FitB